MKSQRTLSVVVLILLAGCIGETNGGDPPNALPQGAEGNQLIDFKKTPGSIDAVDDWGVYRLEAAGMTGSWGVFFREFPNLTAPQYTVEMSVEARGDGITPLGLFVTPPSMLSGNETPIRENTRTWAVGHGDLYIDPSGKSISKQYSFQMDWEFIRESESTRIRGLYAVVGSTGEWTVNITVTNLLTGTEKPTGPSFTSEESGVTLAYPGEAIPGTNGSPLGRVGVEKILKEGGWTHLEFFSDPVLYGTYHYYFHDCRWAVGDSGLDCSDQYGGDDDRISAWGIYPSEPGLAWINISYLETTKGLELAIMHLPGHDMMPGKPQGIGYALYRDIFDDGGNYNRSPIDHPQGVQNV